MIPKTLIAAFVLAGSAAAAATSSPKVTPIVEPAEGAKTKKVNFSELGETDKYVKSSFDLALNTCYDFDRVVEPVTYSLGSGSSLCYLFEKTRCVGDTTVWVVSGITDEPGSYKSITCVGW